MRTLLAAAVLTALVTISTNAQDMDKDFERMQTAMVAAQAAANRPGDEALSCEALQKQFMPILNTPAVQAYTAKYTAAAAQQQKAMATAPAKPAAKPQTPAALMSGLMPAGGWAGLMAAQSQAPGQTAQMAPSLEKMKQQMNDVLVIMPQLMRAQRLVELAMVGKCQWLQAPPERPPARVPGR
jgi:hypothetical protein